jgi:hypothetical protein
MNDAKEGGLNHSTISQQHAFHVEMNPQTLFSNNLIDIKIQNGQIAMIKHMGIGLKDLEERIAALPYSGERRMVDEFVERARLPNMVETFFVFLFEKGYLPDQDEFVVQYLTQSFQRDENGQYRYNNVAYRYEGLKTRILRAYPSLIRDTCFYFMASESGLFEDVSYSLRQDVFNGLDIKVVKDGTPYFVSLFTETKNALKYKKKKYKRHDYSDIREICITLNPFEPKYRVGHFALYRKEHLDMLLAEIESFRLAAVP